KWFTQNVYEERSAATNYFVSLDNKAYFPSDLEQISIEYVHQRFKNGGWACMDFLSPIDRRLFKPDAVDKIIPEMTIFANLIYPYNGSSYGFIVFCGSLLNSLCLSLAIKNILYAGLKNNSNALDLQNMLQEKFSSYIKHTFYFDLEACRLQITTKLLAR